MFLLPIKYVKSRTTDSNVTHSTYFALSKLWNTTIEKHQAQLCTLNVYLLSMFNSIIMYFVGLDIDILVKK